MSRADIAACASLGHQGKGGLAKLALDASRSNSADCGRFAFSR
ncbi:hypothetical protein [Mesorhizobium sangaii]|uniref:Uncharacterized protein n=1 Tax=Mesorhizobium sangaii TaxID=505389 RepID=A0A841PMB3_9HYPH|nr:hypothetical protein [Mesorhizobium sangaii]MBB6411302.1 hypothetical protein [Mesorhizobium sangaii]